MSRLYNWSFKLGFVYTISTFVLLNVGSYLIARNEYRARLVAWNAEGVHFSGFPEVPNWGFPFSWFSEKFWVFETGFLGTAFNFSIIVGIAFIVGLLYRFISLKRTHTE